MSPPLFDLMLAAALPLTAWRALAASDLFKAAVYFIVFGLLMALAWARLAAPDIALAEAAIGAGLTGALLLDAVAHLREVQRRQHEVLRRHEAAHQAHLAHKARGEAPSAGHPHEPRPESAPPDRPAGDPHGGGA